MQYRFENKYDLLKQCYQDTEIKRSGKALMQYLVYISNKEHCVPAVDTIASALSISKRTVQRHMRTLEQRGYIIRKSRYYNHEQLTNQYIFNFGVTTETAKSDKPYPANQGKPVRKVDIIQSVMNSSMHVTEKACYIYLTHICNKAGYVRKSLQDIAKAVSISFSYVKAVIYRMMRKGLLKGASVVRAGKEFVLHARMDKLDHDMSEQQEELQVPEDYQISEICIPVNSCDCKEVSGSAAHGPVLWSRALNLAGKIMECLKTNIIRLFNMLC